MCRTFPTRTPSQVFGLWDDVIALDFDCAAAWVFRRGEDRKAIDLAKLQSAMLWGTGESDGGGNEQRNVQSLANGFFR